MMGSRGYALVVYAVSAVVGVTIGWAIFEALTR